MRSVYSVYWSTEVHLKTSPPTPLLAKERGDEAQLYRGEVELYLSCLRIRYILRIEKEWICPDKARPNRRVIPKFTPAS
jgi:hypothetical protein